MELLLIAMLLLAQDYTYAQAVGPKQEPPKPTIAQPTTDQKAELIRLARAWEKEANEAELARKDYLIRLMSVLAELGHKPSETIISWDAKGEPVFSRAEQAKAPPPATDAKKPE